MKKTFIVSIVAIALAGGVFWKINQRKRQAAEARVKVAELTIQAEPLKAELLGLYQKRYELMISWQKTSGKKIPDPRSAPPVSALKTETDLQLFDQFQNEVSEHLSALLLHPEIQKKKKDLEKLEEKINRTRESYHQTAFAADALIESHKTEQILIPVFPAEKMLHSKK